jgi:hypothetical protein
MPAVARTWPGDPEIEARIRQSEDLKIFVVTSLKRSNKILQEYKLSKTLT